MKNIIRKLYHTPFLERLFPTSVYLLKTELNNCSSVLDLGCGPDSPLQYCKNVTYSLGVEPFLPYLTISRSKKIHSKYLSSKIEDLKILPRSFDAVIMIEVLEHIHKKQGKKIIRMAEKWAKKKVIITTPNGFVPQKNLDSNILQKHLSGWSPEDFKKLGYNSKGLSGLKIFRKNNHKTNMGDDLTSSIFMRPKYFWFLIATFSQMFTYFIPNSAFEIFNVKNK